MSSARTRTLAGACVFACGVAQAALAQADEVRDHGRAASEATADSSERGVVGLRGSYTDARTGSVRDHGAGLVLTGFGDAFLGQGPFSARASHLFAIGGGSAGFEGALGGLVAVGLRAPIGPQHGPFLRAALRGEFIGNDLFYVSRLELPEGQVGYQLIAPRVRFELGFGVAPVLLGRLRVGDLPSRNLGGTLALGGFATAQTRAADFSVEVVQLAIDGAGGADTVHMGTASTCARAAPIAICADLRVIGGGGAGGGAGSATYGGITLALARP